MTTEVMPWADYERIGNMMETSYGKHIKKWMDDVDAVDDVDGGKGWKRWMPWIELDEHIWTDVP